MEKITLKGLAQVGNMKFNHIEGGFGKDKKSILAKDIARIHNRELREINERVNVNRKRFKDGVDIIDLLGINLTDTEIKNFGFTQQAINSYRGLKAKGKTTGIYILSERGYSKLLKILEDDFAWEQYEKLVDGYFNMRKTIKNKYNAELKTLEVEARIRNARARQGRILMQAFEVHKDKLSPIAIESFISNLTEVVAGYPLLPKPKVEKTYTATEIAKELNVSANKIGRVANANNLKTDKYGVLVLDKSPYSNKQVETFRYNDKGKTKLIELIKV